MSLFGEIEKTIERGFRRWTERMFGAAESGDLVIVHRAILTGIESKVQVVARGRRIFPFGRVLVTLTGDDEARRALLQGAFGERLPNDVREMLESAGCEIPRGFTVEVRTASAGEHAYEIEYFADAPKPAAAAPLEPGRLIVVKGKAERGEYGLDRPRINLGRMAELTDADHRVVRRNDIVFEEGADEVNATVSRRHAHIRIEEGEYRLADDGSEFGTRVFRDGRSIEVPGGDRRGERLRPGDEIYLGRACLRFER
jgi:hypothetical protein